MSHVDHVFGSFTPCFLAYFCCVLPQIQKSPSKIAPNFFVICWFDDVLLILIREFIVLQVDLAFPHHLTLEIHPKSSNFSLFLSPSRAIPVRS